MLILPFIMGSSRSIQGNIKVALDTIMGMVHSLEVQCKAALDINRLWDKVGDMGLTMMTSLLIKEVLIILEAQEVIKRIAVEATGDVIPTTTTINTKASTILNNMVDTQDNLTEWDTMVITSINEEVMVMVVWVIHMVCNNKAVVTISLGVFIRTVAFKTMIITKERREVATGTIVAHITVYNNSSKVLLIN